MGTYIFKSDIYKLGADFFNQIFNIPIYQRLYVWEEEQVSTLLEDLIRAYQHNEKHIYYLGGIVVVENNGKFDLIDGQQRFTTLKILREILGDGNLTLKFSIRDNVWNDFNTCEETDNTDIQRMKNAKRLLEIGLEKTHNNKLLDKKEFLKYIKEQVNLVVTTVPKNTNLNKLFELINGRGEQLQQHEILKAKILSNIIEAKEEYGKIWDICANMDEHIEINIKQNLLKEESEKLKNISWGDYFQTYSQLNIDDLLNKLSLKDKQTDNSDNSINKIIESEYSNSQEKSKDQEDEASTQYLSIISFPLFLLYTLVSFKKDNYFNAIKAEKIEFKDKNLIKIFETVLLCTLDEDKAQEFIEYLFKFRKLFDKLTIRNHKDIGDISNDTNHQIINIKKIQNGKVVSRQIEDLKNSRDLSLLQSMLYHSHTRNTQEWIIPFLSNNIENINNIEDNVMLLKNIDNVLYSQFNPCDDTVLKRANTFSEANSRINCSDIINYLNPKEEIENYHYFSHYWFYKIDWIIWDLSDKKDSNFKFTARNSIEHISPQTVDEENKIDNTVSSKYEHSFGNLSLISVSQNSSFSNKSYLEKMAEFKEKKIQNLKMGLIYNNITWNDKKCKKHLYTCLQKIKQYYQQGT
jgi:hypothetical protein